MAYSLEPVSQDCYPGTTVLVNNAVPRQGQKEE